MRLMRTTNSIEVFQQNLARTDALIEAMDTIRARNRIYQENLADGDPNQARIVRQVQNDQLAWIERACSEHAIISLATAYETYYKEMIPELLAKFPDFFLLQHTACSDQVRELIESEEQLTRELVLAKLKVTNRFEAYRFLTNYSIPFLTREELNLVEYVFAKRNSFIHNGGKPDRKLNAMLDKLDQHADELALRTEVKRLRTKFAKVVVSVHDRVLAHLVSGTESLPRP